MKNLKAMTKMKTVSSNSEEMKKCLNFSLKVEVQFRASLLRKYSREYEEFLAWTFFN